MVLCSNTNPLDETGPYPLPALVVAAFNRRSSLLRLLKALAQANYPDSPIPLVISIDKSPTPDVIEAADSFSWPHGPKEVIRHPENLGLKAHLLSCGDLSQRFGSAIVLEDDLMISPYFYGYAQQALAFYQNRPQTAGVSLYHYETAESSQLPFRPLSDDSDVYHMQWPSSWGQAWTAAQWLGFRNWLAEEPQPERFWPQFVKNWESGSWKRLFLGYMIAKDLYFAFPRTGLSSHFGEPGEHSVVRGAQQTPLQALPRNWRFVPIEESQAVYDAWFELLPDRLQNLVPSLSGVEFSVDLYGQKEAKALSEDWVLTTKPSTTAKAEQSWSTDLLPLVQNIILDQAGEGISLLPRTVVPSEPLPPTAYLSRLSGGQHMQGTTTANPPRSISLVLVCPDGEQGLQTTLAQLPLQNEVDIEVVLVKPTTWVLEKDPRIRIVDWAPGASYWEALAAGCRAAAGDLLFWISPGAKPQEELWKDCLSIMGKYPGIEWLLLRPNEMVALPSQRWTRDRLGRASLGIVQAHLGPGVHVWRRSLVQKLNAKWTNEFELWRNLAEVALPFSANLLGAGVGSEQTPWTKDPAANQLQTLRAERSWSGILFSRILRPFFLTNSSLRWAHMQIEHYPPTLQKHNGQWEMRRF